MQHTLGLSTPVMSAAPGCRCTRALLTQSGLSCRLVIISTPLSMKAKLRPELAAYKSPMAFMRPKSFDGGYFNAGGNAYMMEGRDAEAYGAPYQESDAASSAVAETMNKVRCGGVEESHSP